MGQGESCQKSLRGNNLGAGHLSPFRGSSVARSRSPRNAARATFHKKPDNRTSNGIYKPPEGHAHESFPELPSCTLQRPFPSRLGRAQTARRHYPFCSVPPTQLGCVASLRAPGGRGMPRARSPSRSASGGRCSGAGTNSARGSPPGAQIVLAGNPGRNEQRPRSLSARISKTGKEPGLQFRGLEPHSACFGFRFDFQNTREV